MIGNSLEVKIKLGREKRAVVLAFNVLPEAQ
jgi:hypothetical protein